MEQEVEHPPTPDGPRSKRRPRPSLFTKFKPRAFIIPILYALPLIVGIILFSLMLGGSTSSSAGVPSFYLLRLLPIGASSFRSWEIRINYLGFCILHAQGTTCATRAEGYRLPYNVAVDPALLDLARSLGTNVFDVSALAVTMGFFFVGAALMMWKSVSGVKTGRLPVVTAAAFFIAGLAGMAAFVGVLWGVRGVRYATQYQRSNVIVRRGGVMLWSHLALWVYSWMLGGLACAGLFKGVTGVMSVRQKKKKKKAAGAVDGERSEGARSVISV